MLSIKNIPLNIEYIPSEWIFEFYCNLDFKLTGQPVLIKSFFNEERTPSMRIFLFAGKYVFKDFSSGNSGTGIDFVSKLYKIDMYSASVKIIEDYNKYLLNNNYEKKELIEEKFKLETYEIRKWNNIDKDYWVNYGIPSSTLNYYNVKALNKVVYAKYVKNKKVDEFTINKQCMYGYFKKDETLYKIYNPLNKKKKFLKINDYLQGSEQLNNNNLLVITSSLKDIMCLYSMNLNVDLIAPDSETTMIEDNVINVFKNKYEKIITLFDNDETGFKTGILYKERFDIKPVILTLEKDPSDSVKKHGVEFVRKIIKQII